MAVHKLGPGDGQVEVIIADKSKYTIESELQLAATSSSCVTRRRCLGIFIIPNNVCCFSSVRSLLFHDLSVIQIFVVAISSQMSFERNTDVGEGTDRRTEGSRRGKKKIVQT